MDLDPFDQWYGDWIDAKEKDNLRIGEFEFYTISHDAGSAVGIQDERILPEEIDDWIDRRVCELTWCDDCADCV